MKKKYILIITGMPATGKTTNGKKIARKLHLPFFSKDAIKEILFDSISNNNAKYEDKRKIGVTSYDILYYQTEELMKAGISFILESNFVKQSSNILKKLISTYNYTCITIRFESDLKILHKRFLERETTSERHPGLIENGAFDNFENFKKQNEKCNEFKINNNEIIVDTTNFNKINIDEIINYIKKLT